MSTRTEKAAPTVSSMSVLERAGRDGAPSIQRMPLPSLRVRLPMRDGVRLDTCIWLPDGDAPAPAILLRTPYREHVMGWERLGVLRYVQAGYALVIQVVRGVGESEGRFSFNSPADRADGYDTVEWLAAQAWCDGAVGMDGSSYVGMTQLSAAAERPPHLRCIVPCVPSVDFFREIPYFGGAFSRVHSINWTNLLQIDSLAEQKGGFTAAMPILAQPEWLQRMTSRPLLSAADGVLSGDRLAHYREALAHPTFDAWWRERTLQAQDYAAIDLPALVVSGNFDLCIGSLTLWRQLEAHAGGAAQRQLLIGPWDHGQAYTGGAAQYGPYRFGDDGVIDMVALRLAFFDLHLRGRGAGPALQARVQLYLTGANRWLGFDRFPPKEVSTSSLYLRSAGRANSVRGDGVLSPEAPPADEAFDQFISDPVLPFVPAFASADAALLMDLREMERCHEVLVYSAAVLEQPLAIVGEPGLQLHLAADAPDCDVVVMLAEARADGQTIRLAMGALRLRYREGWDRELPLVPGTPVEVRIPLTYVAHSLAAGSRLRLLIGSSLFPLLDPNPNTGEPVATAIDMRVACETVFHDAARPSSLVLPVLLQP